MSAARKIAFVSPHCLVDFTNGAATATRDGLKLLAAQGFQCQAFCGTRLDEAAEGLIQEQLFRRKIDYEVRKVRIAAGPHPNPLPVGEGTMRPHPGPLPKGEGGYYDARMIFLNEGGVAVTMFENGSTRGGWFGPREVRAFLAACDLFLRKNRPDVVVTYGGDPVSLAVQRLVKRQGIPLVFWLHNFAYTNLAAFAAADYVVVPSEFSRAYYRERLGLECHVLPNIVNWQAAEVRAGSKGQGAGEKREGESEGGGGGETSKVAGTLRVPSALRSQPQENCRSQGLRADGTGTVPATLADGTGTVPATMCGGYLFDIPARYTSETREVPTPEEVEPWIETIIRLWDDASEYDIASRAARQRAQRWHPDCLAPVYRDFFCRITHQPTRSNSI